MSCIVYIIRFSTFSTCYHRSHSDGYDSGTGSGTDGSGTGGSEGGVFFDAESLEGSEADYSDDEL